MKKMWKNYKNMTNKQYLEKINTLKKWAHTYYVEDNPIATDEEYDKLYHEVLDYEMAHPDNVVDDSPTKRVGGVVRDEFSKAKHIKRMWSMEDVFTTEEVQEWLERGEKNELKEPKKKRYLSDSKGVNIRSVWDDCGTNDTAFQELKDILNSNFSAPKPKELIQKVCSYSVKNKDVILDYFAGSGTTGHAVINLNREDNGKRKYLLVEMGEYFDTVTKPRMQKVIYSDSWKEGRPQTKNGISQIFKYFSLESYEDTLNNLEFKKTKEQEATLDMYPEAKEDYMLNYALDVESQSSLLNIDTFSTPFDYKLKIATSSVGETKKTTIDLVETFNYLLGLVVESMKFDNGFLTIKGKNLKNSKILIIWRDAKTNDELDAFVKEMALDTFDEVYVNGDNNLEDVKLIEQEFKRLMLGE